MKTKNVPLALLMNALKEAGADHIETITTEQATQIHNAADIANKVKNVVEEVKAAAENNIESTKEDIVNLVSDIDLALTSLTASLGITKTEVTKAANAKIVAANKPKEPAKSKSKEKQVDIEDAIDDKASNEK